LPAKLTAASVIVHPPLAWPGGLPCPGCLHESEVPRVLVVEAAGHPAAQLQPVLFELPHLVPLSVAWPGGLPCPWNRGTVDTVACRETARGKRQS
jgi:hypothetical protein